MNKVMRISLILAREDNPRLYDELIQFPKGQRRVNRLRTIAYDGLLVQQPAIRPAAAGAIAPGGGDSERSRDRAEASLELFSDPLTE